MNLSTKIKSFVMQAETEKDAYLKGCKQLAKYMASKKYDNLSFTIKRTDESNKFIFTVYTNLDLGEEQRKYCKMCKEFHCSFFVNEEYNCNRCNLKNFLQRAGKKAQISKLFYNGKMKE